MSKIDAELLENAVARILAYSAGEGIKVSSVKNNY